MSEDERAAITAERNSLQARARDVMRCAARDAEYLAEISSRLTQKLEDSH